MDRRPRARHCDPCPGVLVATGVSYHRLEIDGLDALLGKGVFYGAATTEAPALAGQDVCLVGAGNSAGQAAVHLARYAATVTLIVRGASLGMSMSDYLSSRSDGPRTSASRHNSASSVCTGDYAWRPSKCGTR